MHSDRQSALSPDTVGATMTTAAHTETSNLEATEGDWEKTSPDTMSKSTALPSCMDDIYTFDTDAKHPEPPIGGENDPCGPET